MSDLYPVVAGGTDVVAFLKAQPNAQKVMPYIQSWVNKIVDEITSEEKRPSDLQVILRQADNVLFSNGSVEEADRTVSGYMLVVSNQLAAETGGNEGLYFCLMIVKDETGLVSCHDVKSYNEMQLN